MPVAFIATLIGAMFTLQAYALVHAFDIERILPAGLAPIMVREIAPGFACLTLAMLVGTSIAAEIATMKTNRELDATLAMGIDPLALIIGTRILCVAIVACLLNVAALVFATFGGYFIAVVMKQMPHDLFMSELFLHFTISDVIFSEVKCLLSGLLVGAICTHFGYYAQANVIGIRQSINWSTNLSVVSVFSSSYFINLI